MLILFATRIDKNFHDLTVKLFVEILLGPIGVRGISVVLEDYLTMNVAEVKNQLKSSGDGSQQVLHRQGLIVVGTVNPDEVKGDSLAFVLKPDVEEATLTGIQHYKPVDSSLKFHLGSQDPIYQHGVAKELRNPGVKVLIKSGFGIIQLPVFLETLICDHQVFTLHLFHPIMLIHLMLLFVVLVYNLVHRHQPRIHIESSDAIGMVMQPVVACILLVGIDIDCHVRRGLFVRPECHAPLTTFSPVSLGSAIRVACNHQAMNVGDCGNLVTECCVIDEWEVEIHGQKVWARDHVSPRHLNGSVLGCHDQWSWKPLIITLIRLSGVCVNGSRSKKFRGQELLCGLDHVHNVLFTCDLPMPVSVELFGTQDVDFSRNLVLEHVGPESFRWEKVRNQSLRVRLVGGNELQEQNQR